MSDIRLSSFNPPGVRHQTMVCVLGDTIDLAPSDQRLIYSFALPTKPGGSSAAFSGSTLTPDVAGAYIATVSVGGDSLSVPLYVLSASAFASILPSTFAITDPFSDADKRRIAQAVCDANTSATLDAWNAGTIPSNVGRPGFRTFGGR